jgi:hypothetical protein
MFYLGTLNTTVRFSIATSQAEGLLAEPALPQKSEKPTLIHTGL